MSESSLKKVGALTASMLVLALITLWPGDIPWISDEPTLLATALRANIEQSLATNPLPGSFGIHYGPIGVWIYQALLLLTHDLLQIVQIKQLLSLVLSLWAMDRVLRTLKLRRLTLLLILFSPYFYFFSRQLWDNVLLLPLGAIFFAALIQFFEKPRLRYFAACLMLLVLAFHVHLMVLPLAAAFLLGVAAFERTWFVERFRATSALLLLAACSLLPYLLSIVPKISAMSTVPEAPKADFRMSAALDAVMGWKYFSFVGFFERFFPELLLSNSILRTGIFASGIVGILFFYGCIHFLKSFSPREKLRPTDLRSKVISFSILGIIFHVIMEYGIGLPPQPHYFNAVWPAYFLLIAFGAGLHRYAGRALGLSLTICALLLPFFVREIHRHRGNRQLYYGSTLTNQIAVVQSSCGKQILAKNIAWQRFPQQYLSLVDFYCPTKTLSGVFDIKQSRVVEYLNPEGVDGEIVARDYNEKIDKEIENSMKQQDEVPIDRVDPKIVIEAYRDALQKDPTNQKIKDNLLKYLRSKERHLK